MTEPDPWRHLELLSRLARTAKALIVSASLLTGVLAVDVGVHTYQDFSRDPHGTVVETIDRGGEMPEGIEKLSDDLEKRSAVLDDALRNGSADAAWCTEARGNEWTLVWLTPADPTRPAVIRLPGQRPKVGTEFSCLGEQWSVLLETEHAILATRKR